MAKISDGVAILDSIASRNMGHSPSVMGFAMFNVEMTESMVHNADDGIVFAAMVRSNGLKERESKLWAIKPATSQQSAQCEQAERSNRLAAMTAHYNVNEGELPASGFELDCDTLTLAIGLANAFKVHCPDEIPTFLLDDSGELDIDIPTNSNMVSNRKIARKHDRSRRKAND